MCYGDQSRPPEPPDSERSASGEDLVLTAGDGTRFAAYLARPRQPSGAEILIYPDIRGLHQFYKELALRFADVGITALALDYFGRTAGLTARDESFAWQPHVQQMRIETFSLDVQAALAQLRASAPEPRATFVVGFCMGGALTLISGTNPDFALAGLIPFYAGLTRDFGSGTALENAPRICYPVLAHFGGADPGIPPEAVAQLDQALDSAGVEHTVMVYPGAPHSFFDRKQAEFAQESEAAWRSTLSFIEGRGARGEE
jgi:carboxymethylenebutenolidase